MNIILESLGLIWIAAFFYFGNQATNTGSWVREMDQRKIVSCSPWSYPITCGLIAAIFFAGALFPLPDVLHEVSEWPERATGDYFTFGLWFLLLTWVGYFIVSLGAPKRLEIDLEERTYYSRQWGLLRSQERSGNLDDLAGIYCTKQATLLLKAPHLASTRGVLGMYSNRVDAMADAQLLSEQLQLPILSATWKPY
jgi:hypothetical protein